MGRCKAYVGTAVYDSLDVSVMFNAYMRILFISSDRKRRIGTSSLSIKYICVVNILQCSNDLGQMFPLRN